MKWIVFQLISPRFFPGQLCPFPFPWRPSLFVLFLFSLSLPPWSDCIASLVQLVFLTHDTNFSDFLFAFSFKSIDFLPYMYLAGPLHGSTARREFKARGHFLTYVPLQKALTASTKHRCLFLHNRQRHSQTRASRDRCSLPLSSPYMNVLQRTMIINSRGNGRLAATATELKKYPVKTVWSSCRSPTLAAKVSQRWAGRRQRDRRRLAGEAW